MTPTLLLVHGLGSSAKAFTAFCAQTVLSGYIMHTPDLPGFGARSGEKVSDQPFDDALAFLKDYAQIIEGPLVLVGHSMGGALGLLLIRQMPDKIAGFVSFEGNIIGADCGLLSRKLAGAETIDDQRAITAYLIDFARTLQPSWQMWADDVAPLDPATFVHYARDLVTHCDDGTLLRCFKGLKCPFLYAYGDNYVGHEVLQHIAQNDAHHVPQAGHFVMQDQPIACAQIMANFLSGL